MQDFTKVPIEKQLTRHRFEEKKVYIEIKEVLVQVQKVVNIGMA